MTIIMILCIIFILFAINRTWNVVDIILVTVVTAGSISHFASYQINLNNYLITLTLASVIGTIMLSLLNGESE